MNDSGYFLQMGYWFVITVAVETAVLLIALSRRHSWKTRVFAGIWLTACTYPIVWLVIPQLINPNSERTLYLAVAETFAPVAECLLFWLAFERPRPVARRDLIRDMLTIIVANLASFGVGVWLQQ